MQSVRNLFEMITIQRPNRMATNNQSHNLIVRGGKPVENTFFH